MKKSSKAIVLSDGYQVASILSRQFIDHQGYQQSGVYLSIYQASSVDDNVFEPATSIGLSADAALKLYQALKEAYECNGLIQEES